ncbi:MAG TPA: oxidoreductase [Rhodopirellula baltica]|uniref:Zinc-binding alcohol dehydrogenase n=1 Tax=Rhodopirellula baltica (strain DSM 10527 / NCIMB 13988 / SH1) TaxID=243090 RepID=Q7UHE3_RHOBA|nr:MDR family oxidoreductase [Rhodopirellula baltica]CAD78029.1 putative zinc-binding alcohol dehydrogenase [Rhodopirellula baltica SH 1]HBE66468.1 oxidoreductase [Rhodopirellula baltica]
MKGVLVEKDDSGIRAELRELDEQQLPEGNVTIRVHWSSFNYKDVLAITGKMPVIRSFPMVPGIDLAGVVESSDDERYQVGQEVLVTGYGIGEAHWGGYAELARVPGDWLVPLPEGLTLRQSMAIGTAGFTAMLCVMALERGGVTPEQGPVLVTGAGGGVGSVAIGLLSKLGYEVAAVSGRPEAEDYLKELGAREVLPRSDFSEPGKPLGKERWAGAVDVVGSHTLANICASTQYDGVVTACGLAGGMEFPATVAPFILRGVTLVGIDSVQCKQPRRSEAWQRLVEDLDLAKLETMTNEIQLDDVIKTAKNWGQSDHRGRVVVSVQG